MPPLPFLLAQQIAVGIGMDGGELADAAVERDMRQIQAIVVAGACDDAGLGFAVQKAGREAFVFGSDFPHEVFNAEKCRREIAELLSRSDLTQADKEAVLGGNARRFYGLNASISG